MPLLYKAMKAYFVALLLLSSIGISFVDTSSDSNVSQLSTSESTSDISECGHSTFSKNLKASFRRESDLREYSTSQIYLTKEWVVVLNNPYCNNSITTIFDDKKIVDYEKFNILNGTWILEFQTGELAKNYLQKFESSGKIWSFYPVIEKQFSNKYEPNDYYYQSGDQWYLDNDGLNNGTIGVDINVESAWNEFTGDGVVIGIVDDGIDYSHPDISPNFLDSHSYDYCGDDNNVMPSDSDGNGEIDWHGTAVSGIAGAKGNNEIGIAGVAYNSSIVGIRLLGGDCSRTDSLEAASLSHSLDLVDIYVNSWGPVDDGDILEGIDPLTLAAIETGISQGRNNLGAIYVWANGNGLANRDNSNKDGYANSRYTIAVGAIDWKGEQTTYSEPGSNLFLSAPSNGQDLDNIANIITTDIAGNGGRNLTNYTFTMEGTSSAAPMISGIIALMLEANPNLTWRDVQHILIQTSRKIDSDHIGWFQTETGNWYNHAYGYGLVDATASVDLAKSWITIGSEVSLSTGKIQVNKNILDNNNEGITSNVSIEQGINIESVEILVNITHSTRGDLNLFLESPNGIVSELVRENNQDLGDHYHDWTFTSVVHWGENTFGEWKIKVNDTVSGGASDRIFNNWTMTMYGTMDRDNDGDGLPNYIDSKLGTGINNPDFDADGLLDGAEFYGWNDRNGNYHKTDPKHVDSDRDGLRDMYEGFNGTYVTDPNNNDTDGDGIYDGEEVNEYFTNPTSTDTDNDTIGDYQEINAFDLGSKYSDPTKLDSDNDTMPDPYELANGFDPMIKSDGDDDADMDGFDFDNSGWPPSPDEYFTNAMEYLAGTDPNNPDSDDDGMRDGWEFVWGLDPLTADSHEDFDNDNLSNILEYDNRRIENTIFSYDEPFVKGYWKFDGTDSTSASNMVPNSDIAIVLNGAGRESAKFKKGVNCDGINDGVRFNSINSNAFNEYTVQSWVKLDNFTGGFSTIVGTVVDGKTWLGINSDNQFEFKVRSGGNLYSITNNSIESKIGVWYHVAATYSESLDMFRLFVNGTLISEGELQPLDTIEKDTDYNYMCRSQGGDYLNGTIDNIAIWNRALTVNEINYVFERPLGFGKTYLDFRSDDGNYYSNPAANDTDNDGLSDIEEAYYGSDGYITDITSSDTDGDSITDYNEVFVFNTSPVNEDTDGDNYTDYYTFKVNVTTGFRDNQTGDAFPLNYLEWNDTDGDGLGDNSDAFPLDKNEQFDTDGDTLGDNFEVSIGTNPELADTDSDGANDSIDIFPKNSTEWLDTDGDGYGDNSDVCPEDSRSWNDTDQDGYCDRSEPFPSNPNEWLDTDGDGFGDNSDAYPNDPNRFLSDQESADIEPQISGSFLDSAMLIIIALGVVYFVLKYFLKS